MTSKAKTAIGLEVTCSKVKLVEIVSSVSGMKITNFAVFDYPSNLKNSTKTAEQIKDAIGRTALDTKEIYGVVSGPLVEHRIVLLPPMTEQEMHAVTRREASKVRHGESASGMSGETALQNVSFGFDVVGRIDKGGIKKTAVLIATAPYELVTEQMRLMAELGIRLRGLTIIPLALFHALGQAKEYYSEEDSIAFIHAGIKSACIIMVSNNSLLFSREFSLASGAEVIEANHAERLIAEVKRSFLYFKQRYRGKEVGKGILSGDIQDLRNPATLLAKELDIEVDVFGLPNGLEISLPGKKMSEFQSLLPSLTIPMGLAIAGLRQSRVNLLSREGTGRKGVWRTAIPLLSPFGKGGVRGIASGLLLLMLFGSYLWLSITNFCTQRKKLVTLKALESLRPELENINKLQEERHEHDARLLLIERLNAPRTHWSELFREISWLVPEDIVFDKLEARQEKGQRQRMIIEGKADGKDKFNKFLSHLQNSSSMAVGTRFIVPNESGSDKSNPCKFIIECEVR